MTVKSLLIDTLDTFGYPVLLHGSIAPDEPYPQTFITFRVISSDTTSFDNDDLVTTWQYNIHIYSRDPSIVSQLSVDVRSALKNAGFIPQGRGYDAISDEPEYIGWTYDFYYLETEGL